MAKSTGNVVLLDEVSHAAWTRWPYGWRSWNTATGSR